MAFPVIQSTSGGTGTSTSVAVTLPSGVTTGDLLLCYFCKDGATAGTGVTGSGWAELANTTGASQAWGAVYWKIADGSDSLTINYTAGSEVTAWAVYRIDGWHGSAAPEATSYAKGFGTAPDPASLSPSWGAADTLWIAAYGWDDATKTPVAYPSSYTLGQVAEGIGSTAGCYVVAAGREVNASSEDPGAGEMSGADNWWAFTIAVRPAGGGGGNTIAVPSGALTLTGYAPTVASTANQTVSIPAGSISLTGYAPTVSVSADKTIAIPAGALTLTGYAPTVVATANQTIAVPAGALTLTGFAPNVISDASKTIQVPAGALTLTGYAPSVVTTGNNLVSVPLGQLTLTGYAPTVSNGEAPVVVSTPTPAGRARRVRRPLVVEIDGEDFIVGSEEEAVELLDKAKAAAEEKAQIAVSRAAVAKRRKTGQIMRDARKSLEVPTIKAPGLDGYAARIIDQIRDTYESAFRSIEVAALLHKRDRDEEDDEEILMLIA